MTEWLYSNYRCGKYLMQMLKWKYLTCKKCGTELILKDADEYREIKVCPRCGGRHILLKKLRPEAKE